VFALYLKKIEIQGFKSFADRTTIEFKDDITAIVGPNGSGKSNISDAIRWVLGEQSVKSLRGNKMEDVIFSGTDKRRALGFAEVSIFFDNTDNCKRVSCPCLRKRLL
jgi:chromosome segregation protein